MVSYILCDLYCNKAFIKKKKKKTTSQEPPLGIQWLTLCVSSTGDSSLLPGWEAKIPHATQHGQKKKKKNN